MINMYARLLAVAVVLAKEGYGKDCPQENTELKSLVDEGSAEVTFVNEIDGVINLYWVDFQGTEQPQGQVMALSDTVRRSYAGHAFRARWGDSKVLVSEYIVPTNPPSGLTVHIEACDSIPKNHVSISRDLEFIELSHDPGAPCLGSSKEWSCIKYLTENDLKRRDKHAYGIQPNETLKQSTAYRTVDHTYVSQIKDIPSVTQSPGYHKMSFTQNLKDLLVEWYFLRRNDSMHKHDVIPGGYTNNDKVDIDKINLDKFPRIHSAIVKEMRQILEWWTGLKLKHTSTFGVRIYRRDSVLINHVDRSDTHIASAVIQIHQEVDEGWPLELYLPNGKVAEVYLQPQELVLYEGAWLRHGRPMRFKGFEFANVFSHFAPPDWKGPKAAGASSMYNGVPANRLTTLADTPGIMHSNYFDSILPQQSNVLPNKIQSPSPQNKIPEPPLPIKEEEYAADEPLLPSSDLEEVEEIIPPASKKKKQPSKSKSSFFSSFFKKKGTEL